MQEDSLLHLLESGLYLDTKTILNNFAVAAIVAANPVDVYNRFVVLSITHCKDRDDTPQHEFLVIELSDTARRGSDKILIFLERTASNIRPSDDYFNNHPESYSILQSIFQSRPFQDLDESEQSLLSRDSILDTASVAATKIVYSTSNASVSASASSVSLTGRYEAKDCFIGAKNIDVYGVYTRNVNQVHPQSLFLFDLLILADVVHDYDPIYSLLKSQCFWYACTICKVVSMEYTCSTTGGNRGYSGVRDSVRVPRNQYLPDLAGRWYGILITRVERAVSEVIRQKFRTRVEEKKAEVFFFVILEQGMLTFDTGAGGMG